MNVCRVNRLVELCEKVKDLSVVHVGMLCSICIIP